jgi:hypothetical protein
MAPGKGDQEALSFTPDNLYSNLPITSGAGRYSHIKETPSWIELYFETAPGTDIDSFSVLELFRVEATNHALTFTPTSVRGKDFTLADPREGWEQYQRLEIRGLFTNTTKSGIITFRILPGLTDNQGNQSNKDYRIILYK